MQYILSSVDESSANLLECFKYAYYAITKMFKATVKMQKMLSLSVGKMA